MPAHDSFKSSGGVGAPRAPAAAQVADDLTLAGQQYVVNDVGELVPGRWLLLENPSN